VVDNQALAGSGLREEHGLAVVIATDSGGVLFDTGASPDTLAHNLNRLGIEIASIRCVALSHAHRDHTGGLAWFLERRGRVPVYAAHEDFLAERYSCGAGGCRAIGLPLAREQLERLAELHISPEPQELLPGVWASGQIRVRAYPEGHGQGLRIMRNGKLVPDPYRDDLSLVVAGKDGLTLICGCAHAGLLNVVWHVREVFGQFPVQLIGGFHLGGLSPDELSLVVAGLQEVGAPTLYPNHCTGERAIAVLSQAYPNGVRPCPAGTTLDL
jgi:7,8-dihydropterin-6-yl-methyl-4-(beta-D-ribofuranosyl)aminobenzene 5'-phosphate synthase